MKKSKWNNRISIFLNKYSTFNLEKTNRKQRKVPEYDRTQPTTFDPTTL